MKKRIMTVFLILILLTAVWCLDLFLGNPLCYALVKRHSAVYLQESYPASLQLQPWKPRHDWYNGGGYEVLVTSPVSRDTQFTLHYDRLGRLRQDTYSLRVTGGLNTFSRLEEANRVLMEPARLALEEATGLQTSFSLASDWVTVYDGVIDYPFYPSQRLVLRELEVDGAYSAMGLCQQYGKAVLEGESEVTTDALCACLLALQGILEEAGTPVATVDVYLYDAQDNHLGVAGFPYVSIGATDFRKQVESAALAWEAFQREYDALIAARNQNE